MIIVMVAGRRRSSKPSRAPGCPCSSSADGGRKTSASDFLQIAPRVAHVLTPPQLEDLLFVCLFFESFLPVEIQLSS